MSSSVQLNHSKKQSESMNASFGILKPNNGCDIDDLIVHMKAVAASLENAHNINVAILRSLDSSWAAVFATLREGSQGVDRIDSYLPEAGAFADGLNSEVKIVNSGYFRLSCQQTRKGKPFEELSLGDVVSIRRIHCNSNNQDMLSYACLAILRSYFNRMKGICWYSFYDSLDGKRIIGVGVWDNIQSALAMLKNADSNPALPFWKGAGAKHLKFHVCHVVYATDRCLPQNCNPAFTL